MNRCRKIISAFITLVLALFFTTAAAYFALHYNDWFVREELPANTAVSFSDTKGSVIVLNMETARVTEGISDEALDEKNIYGFTTGDSPYLIYVEKGAHTLSIFEKDSYGLYTRRIYTWSTATGKTSLLTPVGVFAVGKKERWHTWPVKTYSPYATNYYSSNSHNGGLFIHGPIYAKNTIIQYSVIPCEISVPIVLQDVCGQKQKLHTLFMRCVPRVPWSR